MALATVTAFYFRKENVILRLPFTLCLQNAAYFLEKAKWEGEVISEAYHLDRPLVIFIGLVVAIGLFTPLGNLKKFYTWLIEQVILMIAFLAVFSYRPSDLKEEISAQVFLAVSVAIALLRKRAAILSANQTVAMFIVFSILVHIVTSLFVGATSVLQDICLVYLVIESVIQLYKAYLGVLQLVQDFPGFMIHTGRIILTYGWLDCFIFHWERIGLDEVWMGRWLIKFLGKFIFSLEHGVLSGIRGSFVECSDIHQDLLGASIVVGVAVNVALDIINRILERNVERTMEERHQVAGTERMSFLSWTLMVGLTIVPKSGYRNGIALIMYGTISSFISSRLWYELTKPALVDLGANYTGVFNTKHLRTLAVCAVILILLGYLVLLPCQLLPFDLYLFGVISCNLVTIVQVTGSLFTYALLILNFHFNVRDLDEYIYDINAGSNFIEFLVGVFVFFYLVWMTATTDWNITVAMPSSWFAFSVIKRALDSRNKSLLERSVLKTLNSLEWATEEQLEQLNDVCCICLEELDSAKVTKCKHHFHRCCLRRCLYKQYKCPLCHADILPQN